MQSLNFSRFDSMRKIKFLATFYLNILLPGYSMPVCALARNRGPLQPLKAIAGGNLLLQIFSVLTKCTLEKANPMGASDHAVSKRSDRRIFRAGSALAPTVSLLRPGRILKGGRLCRQRPLKPHSCGASWRDKKLPAGGTQPKSSTELQTEPLSQLR